LSTEVSDQLNMGYYSIKTFDEVCMHFDLFVKELPESTSIEFFRSFPCVIRGCQGNYWSWCEVSWVLAFG
jgi:hypothetical protein